MKTYPLYIKALCLLLLAILLVYTLINAKFILVPLTLGSLFAILLTPVASRLEKMGAHRSLSSLLCIVVMAFIVSSLVFLVYTQIISFLTNLPQLTSRLNSRLSDIQGFIDRQIRVSPTSQINWLKNEIANESSMFSGALLATTSTFATFALIPLYTFFMLFYRDRIMIFFEKITPDHQHDTVHQIVEHIKGLVQSYLSGILIVMFIISVIVSVGLKIIGVPYAIFLGVLAGILNVIPYLGIFTGAALSILLSAIMMDAPGAPLFVLFLFLGTHLLEANIITPRIVGSKVSINTMASLLALIVGEEIWGIVGMILFIPMLGIVKVVLDNFKELEPYGYLLGMEKTGAHSISWKGTIRKAMSPFKKPENQD